MPIVLYGFAVCGPMYRTLTGFPPIFDCLRRLVRRFKMACDDLRHGLVAARRGEQAGDPPVQGPARSAQQRVIGSILYQGVPEEIARMRRRTSGEDQT